MSRILYSFVRTRSTPTSFYDRNCRRLLTKLLLVGCSVRYGSSSSSSYHVQLLNGLPDQQLIDLYSQDRVHPIHDTTELQRRKQTTRFYGYLYDNRPVYILQVALRSQIPQKIPDLFDDKLIGTTVACFYSISALDRHHHQGRGADFLKQTQSVLRNQDGVTTVVTLSPIPSLKGRADLSRSQVAQYVSTGVDPVARFHLGNGAQLYNVVGGDDSFMVNYRYYENDACPDRIHAQVRALIDGGEA